MRTLIPIFRDENEEARFWDTHDSTEYLAEFEEDSETIFVRPENSLQRCRMKKIALSYHAQEQAIERGATENEIIRAIQEGEESPAKKGRTRYRLNFPFDGTWGGKKYSTKQVMPIVAVEEDQII